MTVLLATLVVVFASMLFERRVSIHHERLLRARGATEATGDVYAIMQVAYPACFLAMGVEGLLRGAASSAWLVAGLTIFGLAKALKFWAIASLGPHWTFRVLVISGASLVRSGPYRFMRHPNYVAVVGELAGVATIVDAPIAGLVAVAGFGALMLRRIVVEERLLGLR
jgi:methyltransferase